MQSQTNAEIVEIDAQAARESAVVVNEAGGRAPARADEGRLVRRLKEALH